MGVDLDSGTQPWTFLKDGRCLDGSGMVGGLVGTSSETRQRDCSGLQEDLHQGSDTRSHVCQNTVGLSRGRVAENLVASGAATGSLPSGKTVSLTHCFGLEGGWDKYRIKYPGPVGNTQGGDPSVTFPN